MKPLLDGDMARGVFNEWSALASIASGVRGFFQPRMPSAWLQPWGTEGALSFYDTAPLRETLEQLVDFDLLNDGHPRLSVGAANIRKGNSVYFDTRERRIGPEHIMASAALPPGFPPIQIDGEHYWDGGVVTNTPLQYLLDVRARRQHAGVPGRPVQRAGLMPHNLLGVYERQKDILYSSRTRLNTDVARTSRNCGAPSSGCSRNCPRKLQGDADVRYIRRQCVRNTFMSVVHLIYREKNYETQTKDYEFSRVSMDEHWLAGVNDTRRTLQHEREWLAPPDDLEGVRTFDITRDFD